MVSRKFPLEWDHCKIKIGNPKKKFSSWIENLNIEDYHDPKKLTACQKISLAWSISLHLVTPCHTFEQVNAGEISLLHFFACPLQVNVGYSEYVEACHGMASGIAHKLREQQLMKLLSGNVFSVWPMNTFRYWSQLFWVTIFKNIDKKLLPVRLKTLTGKRKRRTQAIAKFSALIKVTWS